MRKLLVLAGPVVARYLWNRRKGASGRAEVSEAVLDPDLDRPQAQTEAMERAADVPGGVRP